MRLISLARVPQGAEALLETRLLYLDGEQRRDVLKTTEIASGYPLLDDAEGYGRLNLFAAADGYAAFEQDVTVTMDAAKGGFNSIDTWRNDITGKGRLVKRGNGILGLSGANSYLKRHRAGRGRAGGLVAVGLRSWRADGQWRLARSGGRQAFDRER